MEGDIEEGPVGVGAVLHVLGERRLRLTSGEEALDDPASWEHDEAGLIGYHDRARQHGRQIRAIC